MNLIIWPLIVSLLTSGLCFALWKRPSYQRQISLLGAAVNLFVSIFILHAVLDQGVISVFMGGWKAPYGITMVADILSALMVTVTAVIGFAVLLYSRYCMNQELELFGFHAFFHTLLLGVYGAFLTGDVFNLYVFFEVMLISSFVMLGMGNRRSQLEGALKYMALNLFGSFLFLAGAGILYGLARTLNMADLSVKLAAVDEKGLTTAVSFLFLVAFGLKSAAFPFFSWLPASYHTPPSAVSAVFAGLLTKVGVYAVMRFFSLIFVGNVSFTHETIVVMALITMTLGVLGAVSKNEIRKILSFHIISQIGYMLLGLGMWTPLAVAGAIFYLVHHIIVKANLFLVGGVIHRIFGSYELRRTGDLYRSHPFLAILFLIPALSLAGIPPLSGFFAKVLLIKAGIMADRPISVLIMVLVGIVTLISMTKIFDKSFWTPVNSKFKPRPIKMSPGDLGGMMVPITGLALLTLLIGFLAPILFSYSQMAAVQIFDSSFYIEAVLGRAE